MLFRNWTAFFIGLPFLLVGLYNARKVIRFKKRLASSDTWPAATATVISYDIVADMDFSGETKGGANRLRKAQITYTYSVRGRSFTKSHTLAVAGGTEGRAYLEKELYRAEKGFDIRYDPDDPKISSLDSPDRDAYLFAWLPILICIFCLWQAI